MGRTRDLYSRIAVAGRRVSYEFPSKETTPARFFAFCRILETKTPYGLALEISTSPFPEISIPRYVNLLQGGGDKEEGRGTLVFWEIRFVYDQCF